jgi:hypothetical protein
MMAVQLQLNKERLAANVTNITQNLPTSVEIEYHKINEATINYQHCIVRLNIHLHQYIQSTATDFIFRKAALSQAMPAEATQDPLCFFPSLNEL